MLPAIFALGIASMAAGASASPGAGVPSPSSQHSSSSPHPSAPERLKLFQDLVRAVRNYHVFASHVEKNLGHKWEDELPGLEKEFREAETAEALFGALNHFQNSLHNRHCTYAPPRRPRTITVGFAAEAEWIKGKPSFYVAEVMDPEVAKKVAVGDQIMEMDGVAADHFLEQFSLESNANNFRAIADDIATFLSQRQTGRTATKEGDATSFNFRSRASGTITTVRLVWKNGDARPAFDSSAIDYNNKRCANLPDRNYGPYKLHDMGVNYCLYTSDVEPFDAYPIVRHFSFLYEIGRPGGGHVLRLEQHLLATQLAALPKAKGVILDLRDNSGGNNPNWFFDWWAPGPYVDRFVDIRLHDDFSDRRRLEKANVTGWSSDDVDRYIEVLKNRAAGQEYMKRRPFFCRPEGCDWDNHYTPSHQVTKLPIALLVGPMCISACDSFALTFSENRFGPLVGEPSAAAYTAFRIEVPIRTQDSGMDLGLLRLAFSRDVSGKTGGEIEGQLLPMDVPFEHTFANRSRYDAMLVEGAIKGLQEFPGPGGPKR